MSKLAIGGKKDVHIDQNHQNTQAVHDMDMDANVAETAVKTENHPVTGGQNYDDAQPHPEKETFKHLYP
jgi:hypothetical protein